MKLSELLEKYHNLLSGIDEDAKKQLPEFAPLIPFLLLFVLYGYGLTQLAKANATVTAYAFLTLGAMACGMVFVWWVKRNEKKKPPKS